MSRTDWSKWSAIAEILSAIAILITLVYLAVQTRYVAVQTEQNTAAIQATVRQAMLSEDRESLYKIIEYPFLANTCDLTDEQLIQTDAYVTAFLRMRENHWLQYQRGVLDDETWQAYRAPLANVVLDSEAGRAIWEERRYGFDPGFAESVDELMGETPVTECQ